MDEAVIKHYRRLLRNGFEYAGSFENPSIFLDSVGENIPICGHIGVDYMHLHINIINDIIDDIKYLCTCDPAANVVVEFLCTLIKGKTLSEAQALTPDSFSRAIGSQGEDLMKKVNGMLKLLNRGILRYQGKAPADNQ